MTIYADLQTLDPGPWIELFVLDATRLGADKMYFHGYTQIGPIYWQGQQYDAWPIQTSGFALDPNQPPTPTLSVGNVGGRITALCLAYQDLVGATLTRHRTTGRYLDAANFSAGNPTADPSQEVTPDVWIIDRRSRDTAEVVEWELAAALDFNGRQVPGGLIAANHCQWLERGGYRGPYCGYTGGPVAKADDTPTDDPELDVCGGRLVSCGKRFGPKNELPFGGFPSASLIK